MNARDESEPADLLTGYGYRVHSIGADRMIAARGGEELHLRLVPVPRVPSESRIRGLRESVPAGDIVTFLVPTMTDRARKLVSSMPDVGVISADGNVLLPGLTVVDSGARRSRPRGRIPWGTFAVIRALLRTRRGRTQQELAAETGLSQGSISMALSRIRSSHHLSSRGWVSDDPRQLWAEFMDSYPGPGGTRTFWYSLAPFDERVEELQAHVLLSADGAADLIAPWRRPVKIIAYANGVVPIEEMGLSPAKREESNIEMVIPADRTIAATAAAWGLGCADPVIAAWDLLHVGGNDAEEAHQRLLEFVLRERES